MNSTDSYAKCPGDVAAWISRNEWLLWLSVRLLQYACLELLKEVKKLERHTNSRPSEGHRHFLRDVLYALLPRSLEESHSWCDKPCLHVSNCFNLFWIQEISSKLHRTVHLHRLRSDHDRLGQHDVYATERAACCWCHHDYLLCPRQRV